MGLKMIHILFILSFIYSETFGDWIITEELGVQNEYNHLRREATKTEPSSPTKETNLRQEPPKTEASSPAKETDLRQEPPKTEASSPAKETDLTADKFLKKKPAELLEICSQLKNCQIYKRDKSYDKFPKPETLDEISSEKTDEKLTYELRPLKSFHGTESEKIHVFRCKTHENRVYWLTYGYSDSRIFLLNEVENGKAVSFVGQSEIIPKINSEYPRGKILDDYFYKVTPRRPSEARNFYAFNNSVQFRLCCLIHAARQNADPKKLSFTINYADSYLRSTFHHYKVHTTNDKHKLDKLEVRALGCAINRSKPNDVEFYLYFDNDDPNAVFALELKDQDKPNEELLLTEHFRDINLPIRAAISF